PSHPPSPAAWREGYRDRTRQRVTPLRCSIGRILLHGPCAIYGKGELRTQPVLHLARPGGSLTISGRSRPMAIKLTGNNTAYEVDVPAEMPLLWVIRDVIGLTGTKYGCGVAQCGACTVHIDGAAVRSCITAVGDVAGAVTTIEGLSANGDHPIQAAWTK